MNSHESGDIPAACPECGRTRLITFRDLGLEISCPECGTRFLVVREKHRVRRPGAMRASSAQGKPFGGPSAAEGAPEGMWRFWMYLVMLCIVVVLVMLLWDDITGLLDRPEWSDPEVPEQD